ncbi:MAG: PKD domain-containing protein [Thermoplasmata archaeon]|nr:PKD domain-containing protein [Thermoplasmata archaeon]
MTPFPGRRNGIACLGALGAALLLLGAFPALGAPANHVAPAAHPTPSAALASAACAADRDTCAVEQATASLERHSSAAWVDLTNRSGTAPPERDYGRSMAWDPATGYVLLFGGDEDTGYANDTWAFENGSWTNLSPAHAPSGRDHGTLVWDPVDHYMLMFGGSGDGGAYNDTWKFANGDWTQIPTTSAPSARWSSSLVWDSADGYGLLFGGCAGEVVNDTWTYLSGVWTNVSPVHSPPPVGDASLVYDTATGQVVLFGGADWYGNLNPNTWVYHAGNWTELVGIPEPPARTMASAAYDPALGEEILFGGQGSTAVLDDTWAFSGSAWIELFPAVTPSARYFGEFAWNGANNSLLLFSGGGFDDTWAYYALNVTANATPTNGTAPLLVNLTSTISGAQGSVTVVWQLGNGTMANGTAVNATYTQPGLYFPTVEVTDGSGAYATAMVEVDVLAPVIVNAFADPTSGPAPLHVLFGAAISGGVTPYATTWTVGGSPITTSTNGSYVFSFTGIFALQLTVHDANGRTVVRSFAIVVSATRPPPLSVVVTGGPTTGEAPFNASFAVLEIGGVAPYEPVWSFGDGGEGQGAVAAHTFAAPGTYPVEVVVTDGAADTAAAFLNVTVLVPLTTGVSASVVNGTAPLKVTFTSMTSGGNGVSSVRWDLGDGAEGSGTTAVTTYATVGSYTATAVVTDALGGYAVASVTVDVVAATSGTHPVQHTNQTPVASSTNGVSAPEAGAIGAGIVGAIAVVAGLVLWRRRPSG